jgi:hypothetical protein
MVCMCFQTAKALTWNGGTLCKEANFSPLQSHAASQLPLFQAVGPTLPLTTLDSTPESHTHTHMWPSFNKRKTSLAHRNSSWSDTVQFWTYIKTFYSVKISKQFYNGVSCFDWLNTAGNGPLFPGPVSLPNAEDGNSASSQLPTPAHKVPKSQTDSFLRSPVSGMQPILPNTADLI